ncbi:integrator complex subunit 5 [Parasteatoda tepidariorum]|uniref:integrator complex subunit 5 n=1 Tax=Parasteatoda tepidariorum TaxID=114398 RepID=UPI00077FE22C|nr:integrator complex subunit 5 [Parasteatoda tepidariorum]
MMVSGEKKESPPNPEIVLQQLQIFLNGATRIAKVRNTEVAQAAIVLLKSTEAARDAALEHAYNLFDESVNNFLKLEIEERTTESGDTIVHEFHKVLSGYVETEPETWAPAISTWSLDLLGYLSSKYADRRGVLHATLPEVLQLWMSCPPTSTLIDLTTQCLSTLVNSNPDTCIDALIETSVRHSPHFDWVVAHIGSCFPKTVISRVLACGMKDFMHHDIPDEATQKSKNNPKIASVVGILGHLATHHDSDMRAAVRTLFDESFSDNAVRDQLAAGPFLLHLAAMSDTLSHVISSEFVKVVNPEVLNKMYCQVEKWKSAKIPGTEGLASLVVHLLLRSDGGCQVIRCLLNIMPPSNVEIHAGIKSAAGLILDSVLLEIQRRAYGGAAEIPLLHFLKTHVSNLTCCLSNPETSKASWVLNLLKFICFHGEDPATVFIFGFLISSVEGSALYVSNIYQDIQMHQPNALSTTISYQMAELKSNRIEKPVTLIQNITQLCQREQWHHLITEGMTPNLEVLAGQINSRNTDYSDVVVELLSICVNPKQMPMSSLFTVCSCVVSYFFHLLGRQNLSLVIKITLINNVKSLLANLCQQSTAQHAVLRMLLECFIDKKYCSLFGSSVKTNVSVNVNKTNLLMENTKYMSAITLPQSHSSVFHSGIIGSGLRVSVSDSKFDKDVVLLNKQVALDVIQSCCKASWRFPLDEQPQERNLIPGMKIVALLMVELVSPDVMFNGLPWPDEDYLKVTVERDLHIKRMFEENCLLWDLLSLIASVHPSLCYCSVLLRAIMAVLLTFWCSSQEKTTRNCPKELLMSQRLITIMAMGQLLPPPLSYIDEVLPLITPYEAFSLLSDVWQYMRDNVPSPALFFSKNSNRVWREFSDESKLSCDKKYTNKLRFILFANIEKFGAAYAKFFPSELN